MGWGSVANCSCKDSETLSFQEFETNTLINIEIWVFVTNPMEK